MKDADRGSGIGRARGIEGAEQGVPHSAPFLYHVSPVLEEKSRIHRAQRSSRVDTGKS